MVDEGRTTTSGRRRRARTLRIHHDARLLLVDELDRRPDDRHARAPSSGAGAVTSTAIAPNVNQA